MKIILASSPTQIEAEVHQWEEGDVVIVRFEPDGNLSQDEYYEDTKSKSMRKRKIRSENWIWYAGVVNRVNSKGDIYVKFFDGDAVTLDAASSRLEMKRTTKKRLADVTGNKKFKGIITNAQSVELTKVALKTRTLDTVLEVDEESFEGEMLRPVSKMAINQKLLASVYEEHDWIGSWVMAPIQDMYKKKYSLPAALVGFGLVRGKTSLILSVDLSSVDKSLFKTNWTVMEIFDRDPKVTYQKLDRLVKSAKSKLPSNVERMTLAELINARKSAKKSKRFV